jgi:toxin CptA
VLRLDIHRSLPLALLLAFVHFGAFALLVPLGLPLWLVIVVAIGLAASALHTVLLHAWLALPTSIVAFEVSSDCAVSIQYRTGDWRETKLMPSSFVAPFLTVLNFRQDRALFGRTIVILPDRVAVEPYRKLRVLLRWGCREVREKEKARAF